MKFAKLILIGCLLCSPISAQERRNISDRVVTHIQPKAGIWGMLTAVSSMYAISRMYKFGKDIYEDYTYKDYGNLWTEDGLKKLRIERARRHLFQHLPYVVIPLLAVKLCVEEAKKSFKEEK
jgi:hypothetical protein